MTKRGRVENLKPIKKGEVRNPTGRPKKKPIEQVIQEFLGEEVTDKNSGEMKERLRVLVESQWVRAVRKQDTAAAKFLMENGYGRPKQRLEVTGKDGEAINPASNLTTEQLLAALKELK